MDPSAVMVEILSLTARTLPQVDSQNDHVAVVTLLSERSAALCFHCESLLETVLAAAPSAPRAVREMCIEMARAATGGKRSRTSSHVSEGARVV